MEIKFTPSQLEYKVSALVSEVFKIPPTATAAQLAVFDKKISHIEASIRDQVELEYLAAFDEEMVPDTPLWLEEEAEKVSK